MLKILIVDDEKIELETLEQFVDWHKMGIAVVGTAKNGREALQKLIELKPDIVLTDVRMPIMDGLEFSKRAKQIDQQVKIAFLSGHNEFQYIKSALSVEAVGYLLKPLDMEELVQLMERIKQKISEDRLTIENIELAHEGLLIHLIRERDEALAEQWIHKIAQLPKAFPEDGVYALLYVTLDASDKLNSFYAKQSLAQAIGNHFMRSIIIELSSNTLGAVLLCSSEVQRNYLLDREFWNKLKLRFDEGSGQPSTLVITNYEKGLKRLSALLSSAESINQARFYYGRDKVFLPSDTPAASTIDCDYAKLLSQISGAITNTDRDAIRTCLAQLFACYRRNFTKKSIVVKGALYLIVETEGQFMPVLAEASGELLFVNHWNQLNAMDTLDDIEGYVMELFFQFIASIEEKSKDQAGWIMDKIFHYIHEHFHASITIEDIAGHVYLSPNYVRTLFKKETGETVLDYIVKLRMKRAVELLKNPSLKIHEIARSVGYENISYFCSVFHKHKGYTPNEFRKRLY